MRLLATHPVSLGYFTLFNRGTAMYFRSCSIVAVRWNFPALRHIYLGRFIMQRRHMAPWYRIPRLAPDSKKNTYSLLDIPYKISLIRPHGSGKDHTS